MIILYWLPKWWPYTAISLCFFVLARRGKKLSVYMRNHELIHLQQQREMFFLPFLIWYFLEFLVRLVQYRNWNKAYRNISFEREAYDAQGYLPYLPAVRKPFTWTKYLKL